MAPAEAMASTGPLMRFRRPWLKDAGLALLFVVAAALLTHRLWPDPAGRALALNPNDQALDEWFLAYSTRAYRGDFSLVTGMLNAPEGVNLLCNASLIALGLLFAPVTLALGAPYTFAVLVAGNLAATGIGWFLLFARTAGMHRLAALVGGAFAAFAPGMVSQSNAHLHMTAGWLVPPIVWCVVALATRRQPGVRPGLLLGGLIALQFFVGEEVLFLTAVALGLFALAFAAITRPPARVVRTFGTGLGIAAALAGILLAYPLWLQFNGPQSVRDGVFTPAFYSADLRSFTAISPLSLAGSDSARKLVSGPAEYTAFFGAPVLLVALGGVVWLWRRPAVAASALAAVVLCVLSLGPHVISNHEDTGQWAPFALFADLPVADSALPTRFALAAIPLLAFILAQVVHTALTQTETLRLLVPVAVVAALVPLAPGPLPVAERAPAPRFFTQGYWRGFAPQDGTVVPVPLPDSRDPQGMRWAAATNVSFATPQGWFIGPYGVNGTAAVGIYPRPTSLLLQRAADSGVPPELTDGDRIALRRDIAFWRAACFVLVDGQRHAETLKATLDQLLGPGERVADVWVWRARS